MMKKIILIASLIILHLIGFSQGTTYYPNIRIFTGSLQISSTGEFVFKGNALVSVTTGDTILTIERARQQFLNKSDTLTKIQTIKRSNDSILAIHNRTALAQHIKSSDTTRWGTFTFPYTKTLIEPISWDNFGALNIDTAYGGIECTNSNSGEYRFANLNLYNLKNSYPKIELTTTGKLNTNSSSFTFDTTGVKCDKDYSATYTSRSLVDSAFIKKAVIALSGNNFYYAKTLDNNISWQGDVAGTRSIGFGDVTELNNFYANGSGDYKPYIYFNSNLGISALGNDSVSLSIGATNLFTDSRKYPIGIGYANNYHKYLGNYSWIDKSYADSVSSIGSTLTSNILKANNTTHTFELFTALTANAFYNHSDAPTGTDICKWNGFFYAKDLRAAERILASGGSGLTSITATASNGICFLGSQAGAVGVANPMISLSRQNSGSGNVTGNIIEITDNPSTSGIKSGSLIKGTIGSTERFRIDPRIKGNADSTMMVVDADKPCDSNDTLVSVRVQGVRKMSVLSDGTIVAPYTPIIITGTDTTNNIPSKKGNIFVDDSGNVYVSKNSSRGGWVKLNWFIPILFFRRKSRNKMNNFNKNKSVTIKF
jgi:hypothetical protein